MAHNNAQPQKLQTSNISYLELDIKDDAIESTSSSFNLGNSLTILYHDLGQSSHLKRTIQFQINIPGTFINFWCVVRGVRSYLEGVRLLNFDHLVLIDWVGQ